MHAESIAIAALLTGTAVLVVGTLVTFASTLLGDLAAVATVVVLTVVVATASTLGALVGGKSGTPYW
ncbi:hypothetical protein [Halalkalicoccus subterraneus]|uniref:hypothetical protein n=1 Tax=Halalkalicoccus subterraneus TaxID=2675002 RepID=UPI000EFD0A18|nr:hypothetical protein [Halalkalicoccus subterraneus]